MSLESVISYCCGFLSIGTFYPVKMIKKLFYNLQFFFFFLVFSTIKTDIILLSTSKYVCVLRGMYVMLAGRLSQRAPQN